MGITVIGAGLAGCEAAWQALQRNIPVTLVEMKPGRMSPAHHSPGFAELVCSNSLRSDRLENAGLVTRSRSSEDRRVIRVFLGTAARKCREQYAAVSGEMTEIYFRGFTDDEISSFESFLQRVLENVREADRKTKE